MSGFLTQNYKRGTKKMRIENFGEWFESIVPMFSCDVIRDNGQVVKDVAEYTDTLEHMLNDTWYEQGTQSCIEASDYNFSNDEIHEIYRLMAQEYKKYKFSDMLDEYIKNAGIKKSYLHEKLGITNATFIRKTNTMTFTQVELQTLRELLNLADYEFLRMF